MTIVNIIGIKRLIVIINAALLLCLAFYVHKLISALYASRLSLYIIPNLPIIDISREALDRLLEAPGCRFPETSRVMLTAAVAGSHRLSLPMQGNISLTAIAEEETICLGTNGITLYR